MGPGAVGNQVTIPGVFTGNGRHEADGLGRRSTRPTAQLAINTIAFQVGNEPDVVPTSPAAARAWATC
jgi:hypothetical protein